MSRQLDYIKFRAAHVVNVTVFQRFQLCIIGCACSGLICEHAGGYAKLLDIITQHLNTALVDINLSAQILVFLAQELMRHLHVVRVRVAMIRSIGLPAPTIFRAVSYRFAASFASK